MMIIIHLSQLNTTINAYENCFYIVVFVFAAVCVLGWRSHPTTYWYYAYYKHSGRVWSSSHLCSELLFCRNSRGNLLKCKNTYYHIFCFFLLP